MTNVIATNAHTGLRTATIAISTSLAPVQDLNTMRLFALQMPAVWTAANLTFSVSYDGTTYVDLYDSTGTEVNISAAASRFIVIANPIIWQGIRFVKVRSGTTGVPVVQAAARDIQLVLIP